MGQGEQARSPNRQCNKGSHVKNWLRKMWPLRAALWLFAAALCLVIWPTIARETGSREWLTIHVPFLLNHHSAFGFPILSKLDAKTIEAWDWKTGKRWRFAPSIKSGSGFVA